MASSENPPAESSSDEIVRLKLEKSSSQGKQLESGRRYQLTLKRPANKWIELLLLDADGKPAAGHAYRLLSEAGAELAAGKLDPQGKARVETLRALKVVVEYPDLIIGNVAAAAPPVR